MRRYSSLFRTLAGLGLALAAVAGCSQQQSSFSSIQGSADKGGTQEVASSSSSGNGESYEGLFKDGAYYDFRSGGSCASSRDAIIFSDTGAYFYLLPGSCRPAAFTPIDSSKLEIGHYDGGLYVGYGADIFEHRATRDPSTLNYSVEALAETWCRATDPGAPAIGTDIVVSSVRRTGEPYPAFLVGTPAGQSRSEYLGRVARAETPAKRSYQSGTGDFQLEIFLDQPTADGTRFKGHFMGDVNGSFQSLDMVCRIMKP